MSLLLLRDVHFGFSGHALLESASFQLDSGERICVVGRNGEGKSTLLRLILGELEPDNGELVRQRGLRVAMLPQDVPAELSGPVEQIVASAVVGSSDDWERANQVEAALARVEVAGDALFEELSGGMKRRALLARSLVCEPDLLLLDEPTNHLDIEAIDWLERFLLRWRGALLFVTHDRTFLARLATRILEIDRGRVTDWPGDYARYLAGKQAALLSETSARALFDKRLASEEAWIRQGIKARRTRNEGRVRRLEKMRAERSDRRDRPGKVRMQAQEAGRSGRLVIRAEQVSHGYGGPAVVDGLSTTILRGDRVGIIGANGSGKTTVLRLLCGELTPEQGSVRHGTNLQVAYSDQLREQLDPAKSVIENVGEGREIITINGQDRPVIGYVQDFLFSPDRARTAVRYLSGGERNRVLLARLFTRPSNLLVLDEPTNDLDAETLELLEELLIDYPGTLLLVSHDRTFLDNVVTSTLVLEGDGRVGEYIGGYADWVRQRAPESATPVRSRKVAPRMVREKKLSWKEGQELAALPARIEALENENAEISEGMSAPEFYKQAGEAIAQTMSRVKALEAELKTAYARWEELETLA